MINFLFWNTGKNDVREVVAAAATELDLDFIILCELGVNGEAYREATSAGTYHHLTGVIHQRFCILSKFSQEVVTLIREENRFLIFLLTLPGTEPFLLVTLHGPSKASNWNEASLATEFSEYKRAIEEQALTRKVNQLVIVGDFNANPYETGLVSTAAFHAISDARIARKTPRTVQGKPYNFLYNPMWNLLGDQTPGPPGSQGNRMSVLP